MKEKLIEQQVTADSRGSRHSNSSEHQQHEHPRHRANSGENTSDSFPGRDSTPSSVANAHHPSNQYRDRDRDRESRESHRNRLSVDSNSNNSNLTYPPQHHQHHHHHQQQQHHHHPHHHQRQGSTPGGNNGIPESHQDYPPPRSYSQYDSQHHHQYSSSEYKRQGNDSGRRRRAEGYGSHRFHDTGQGPIDDMDISPSPSPSPSSSQPSSAVGTPQQVVPPTSTPGTCDTASSHYHNSTTPQHQPQRAASPQGNPIPTLVNRQTAAAPEGEAYDATIQTLRQLQNALSMHIIRAQQGNTTSSSGGRSSVSQSTGRQPPTVSNSSSAGSMVSQQQQQQQQQSLQQQHQHPAVVMGGTTIPPGIQQPPPHIMYQQQPQQQQGLLPLPHHHPYQQQPPHQMLPGMAGAPMVGGAGGPGPGQGLAQQDGAMGGRTSPVSATSSRSSCGSPTPSDSSSQNAAVGGTSQALSAAAIKREETAKLTASLSNYYNEKLIGHVLGWQADGIEKQSTKLWEEWMVNGSLQASQISVQLKRVRSQVRIAEIQSTLHEQRIMSSEQQRQEIENLKTPSNFLPS
ncbi:WW domain-containing adapter protein with coiled-coil [Elysia marginata]|uniref:WW domain-containing adapter protein with coiled-coil n=1 Tax=Elysia marginata TaxID=1093978 RepID=A0AAV4GSG1_9GAST|nr:WW domain-containing adapter protein with coiled-coil [Elysia marginata]